jgi:hypothetical protein
MLFSSVVIFVARAREYAFSRDQGLPAAQFRHYTIDKYVTKIYRGFFLGGNTVNWFSK